MSDPKSLETALSLLKDGEAIAPPSVDPLVSVIRSGEAFPIAPTTTSGPHIIQVAWNWPPPLIVEAGYDVEFQVAAQFHRWLLDNELALTNAASLVPGVRYLGTFAAFAQSDLSLGSYRTVWSFDSFDAMQALTVAEAVPGSDLSRLLGELMSFRDRRIGAGRIQQMYQPAYLSRRI
jgi:hypothetical protein